MSYKLNKLEDKFLNIDYFSRIDKKNKNAIQEFTVKDFLELMLNDNVNQIGDHNYSSEEVIKKIVENFSHELIVTTMNNIQYAYVAYKYTHLDAEMFTNKNEEEWYPVVKFVLMLNYVFNPFKFEEKLNGFEQKFPHLDFHFDLNSNLWDSTYLKMKDFQNKYKVSDVILEEVKKYTERKNKKNWSQWNMYEEEDESDDTVNLNLSSIKTDNEVLNFIKNIDFLIMSSDSIDSSWRSSRFQQEAISVLAEEVHKRNLSGAINWETNLLSSSAFEKSNFALYHAKRLIDIRFVLFLGKSIKNNQDVYVNYLNFVKKAIDVDINILDTNIFRNGYVYTLEENIITTLDFIKAWEEDSLIGPIDKVFEKIDEYENKMLSLNRKKSQLGSLNEEKIISKIKEISENTQSLQLKEKVSELLNRFEIKGLKSFNGKVNLNIKKSVVVEIDLDNLMVYQNEKFNNKIKKSELNGYFSKLWKIVSNSLYYKQANFPSEIKDNKFIFVNYEHTDMKMSDVELEQWTEKVVDYMVNKNLKEKHSIEVVEAELEKIVMQHNLLLSEKSKSKSKVVKF